MRKPIVLIAMLCMSYAVASAETPATFVAGSVGGFLTGASNFDKLSDSRFVLSFAGECGIPISQQVSLYARFTYFSKSGISVVSTRYYNYYGQPLATPESFVGNIHVWQLVSNYGVLHSLLLMPGLGVEINGGFTYSIFRASPEDISPASSVPTSPVRTHNAVGAFAGMVLVHQLASGPLSAFLAAQYNYLWPVESSSASNYACVNASAGIRFCLDCR